MSRAQLAERLDGELDEALDTATDLVDAFGRVARQARAACRQGRLAVQRAEAAVLEAQKQRAAARRLQRKLRRWVKLRG